ncbi:hypothetical protein EG68_12397 [Paragonimus skrjabini miyazakii]|uniref:Uncharacterized protein n=1 Tax=Paragonimus skrjabini miyazakii TaxID=59628 RepID=A0A8S9YNG9_9TREM|nr:hypothetical protein EG68_12397 [Paragonimus skrjabini miyazakii]
MVNVFCLDPHWFYATFGAALTMLLQLMRNFTRHQDSHILFLVLFGHLCRFCACCTFPERFRTQTCEFYYCSIVGMSGSICCYEDDDHLS